MASSRGAGSGSGADAAGQDENQRRGSKRPKKYQDDHELWQRAKEEMSPPDRDFHPVDRPEAPANGHQDPPILVFYNAKGGSLKTSHTWNTAYTMSSVLRGLKVYTRDFLFVYWFDQLR